MHLAVFALNLAGFGLASPSQWICRFKIHAPDCGGARSLVPPVSGGPAPPSTNIFDCWTMYSVHPDFSAVADADEEAGVAAGEDGAGAAGHCPMVLSVDALGLALSVARYRRIGVRRSVAMGDSP